MEEEQTNEEGTEEEPQEETIIVNSKEVVSIRMPNGSGISLGSSGLLPVDRLLELAENFLKDHKIIKLKKKRSYIR